MRDFHCHYKTEDAYYCEFEYSLDKRVADTIPIDKQLETLKRQLKKAVEQNLPISLHCVRCTELMIKTLKEFTFKRGQVLWHNFTGSAETAAILFKLGIIVSISPRFRGSLAQLKKENPLFVLETDYVGDNETEYRKILAAHCKKCSEELGMTEEELEKYCDEVGSFFKN